ncbi:MAG: hypothetical protein JJV98_00895 [Desulfosarcina sp.]|nr:hypothetical protein [Desulfobacterales bacterium]
MQVIGLFAQLLRQSRQRHCFDLQSRQRKSAAHTCPADRSRTSVSSDISTRTLVLSAFAIFKTKTISIRFLVLGAWAIHTVSIALAPVVFSGYKNLTSLGCDLISLLSFEIDSIGWQFFLIKVASECAASERTHIAQVMGINNDPSLAVVLFIKQIDKLPGGIAVKNPSGANMQVAVALFDLDLKIGAHALPSDASFGL